MRASKELYDRDFFRWSQETARLLRAGETAETDLALVAEEIEDMGKRDRRTAVNRTRVLLTHLLKWRFQASNRSSSWKRTIIEQRRRLMLIFEDSSSIENFVRESISEIYCAAADGAAQEMQVAGLPNSCPWSFECILDPHFWPEE